MFKHSKRKMLRSIAFGISVAIIPGSIAWFVFAEGGFEALLLLISSVASVIYLIAENFSDSEVNDQSEPEVLLREHSIRFYRILTERFDVDELRTLLFHLKLNYDVLDGDGKPDKVRNLIAFLERRDRIGELIDVGKQLRPDVLWTDIEAVIALDQPSINEEDERDRRKALIRLRSTWIDDRLYSSLQNLMLIDVNLKPGREYNEVGLGTIQFGQEQKTYPSGTRLINLLGEVRQTLLVLGEPGSGKTTLLIKLAEDLLDSADIQVARKIPMILSLSTWTRKHRSLASWIAQQANDQYTVPIHRTNKWLESNRLILLLDGLDEVRAEERPLCVNIINSFIRDNVGTPVIVSSREAEYQDLENNQSVSLRCDEVVNIQLLSDEQINGFIDREQGDLEGLRYVLYTEEHEDLLDLARRPLMLNVMGVVFRGQRATDVLELANSEDKRRFLFDAYIYKMFERKIPPDEVYSTGVPGKRAEEKENTVKWLVWLAEKMESHPRARFIFQIHLLQPSWIDSLKWYWIYILSSRLVISYILVFALTLKLAAIGPTDFFLVGLIGGLIVAFLDGRRLNPFAKRNRDRKKSWRQRLIDALAFPSKLDEFFVSIMIRIGFGVEIYQILKIWLFVTVVLGAYFGLTLRAPTQDRLLGLLALNGINLASYFGIFYGSLFGLRESRVNREPTMKDEDIQPIENFGWSFKEALKGARNYGIGFSLLCVFMASAVTLTGARGNEWLGLVSQRLLGAWFSAVNIVNPLAQIMIFTFILGGVFGAVFGGIFEGVRLTVAREASERKDPNEGIRLSTYNSLRTIFVFGSIVFLFFASLLFLFGQATTNRYTPTDILINSVANAITIGIIAALWNGGIDVIQHHIIRLILHRNGQIPSFKYVDFLDYASRRVFLNKVGGGYAFLHRHLQEHFYRIGERMTFVYSPHWQPIPQIVALFLAAVVTLALVVSANSDNIAKRIYSGSSLSIGVEDYGPIKIGDNIDGPVGIVCDGTSEHCPKISLAAGDTVRISAGSWMHTGQFVTWVRPDGTNTGMLGLPIDAIWSISDIPPGTLHGALLCRVTGERMWQVCGSSSTFTVSNAGFLNLNINGIDYQKFRGHYYVTVFIDRSP